MTPASRHHWFSFSKQETPYSRKIPSPYQAPTQPELVAQLSQLTRSVHFEVIILLWPPAFSCWSLSSFLSKKQQRYIELSKGDCKSLKIELIKWHVQKEEHLQINVFYHKICFFAFQIAATNKKKHDWWLGRLQLLPNCDPKQLKDCIQDSDFQAPIGSMVSGTA